MTAWSGTVVNPFPFLPTAMRVVLSVLQICVNK